MYKVAEIVRTAADNKESQGIYNFETEVEAKGEYESKLGAAMKAAAYNGYIYLLIDGEGKTLDSAHDGDGFSPRLIDVTVSGETETPNISKYGTDNEVKANFHSKWGAAIKNESIDSIILYGIGDQGQQIAYTYWERPTEDDESNEQELPE